MKKIGILGSTGSIGTQALDIIDGNQDQFTVEVLTCGHNAALFSEQIVKYKPALAVVAEENDAVELSKAHPGTEFLFGQEGLVVAAAKTDCSLLLNAIMGMRGMVPTYYAIQAEKDIALANKETLVAGGQLIMSAAQEKGIKFLPVDSEHSAIFQALQGNENNPIKRLILTASGGPFRGFSLQDLEKVSLDQALKHPKWSMGKKITIDSATLMNKGLEVIEARWLFDIPGEQIEVVVHPESIIHSMVEYEDHSIMAQMGLPDMRVPIGYALTYPHRMPNELPALDFIQQDSLTFEKPDLETFKCLAFAYEALRAGGSYPVVLNAANEVLVAQFLEKRISFIEIQNTIEDVLNSHQAVYDLDLEEILEIDRNIRGELER